LSPSWAIASIIIGYNLSCLKQTLIHLITL